MISVSRVEVTSPPMTTTASGFWISEPGPLAVSIGTSPIAAMLAVISTGRSRRIAPSRTTWSSGMPCARSWLKYVVITTPLSTAMPSSAMKPTEAGTLRYWPEAHSATMPPTIANGILANTSAACRTEPKVANKQQEDEAQRDRHHQREAGGGPLLVLELAAPGDGVTRRQLHLRCHCLLGLLDESDQVAPAYVGLHHGVARCVLAVHLHRAIHALEGRHLRQRDPFARPERDVERLEQRGRAADLVLAAQQYRRAPRAFDHRSHPHALQLAAQVVFDIDHRQPAMTGLETIDVDLQILHAFVGQREARPGCRVRS